MTAVVVVMSVDSSENEFFYIVPEDDFDASSGNDMMQWVTNALGGSGDGYASWSEVVSHCQETGCEITDVRGALAY